MKYILLISAILMHISCNESDIFIVDIKYSREALWYVHPDSTLNAIQEALDRCFDHDTVLVAPGTYYENLVWPNTQGIFLVSESGSNVTIIDGSDSGRVILISEGVHSFTVIKGFTVQNGRLEYPDVWEEYGAGIFCDSFSSPIIMENNIKNNYSTRGGSGIGCINSSAIIRNNIISENACGSYFRGGMGAGILCAYGGSPVISDNRVIYNTCGGMWGSRGAGLACYYCDVYIIGNEITDNDNSSNGGAAGGIYFFYSDSWLSNNIINNNIAGSYAGAIGGIYCDENSDVVMKHCDISHNTGSNYCGGIYCQGSSLVIDSCNVTNNNLDGIYIYSIDDSIIVHFSNITGNAVYGLNNNVANYLVNAEYNWWGDPSGPGGAGPGTGDSVSLYVDYEPWLTEPVSYSGGLDSRN